MTIKQETVEEDSSQDAENGVANFVSDCSTTRDDVSIFKMKYNVHQYPVR